MRKLKGSYKKRNKAHTSTLRGQKYTYKVSTDGFCSECSRSRLQNNHHWRRNPASYASHHIDCLTRPWYLVPVTELGGAGCLKAGYRYPPG